MATATPVPVDGGSVTAFISAMNDIDFYSFAPETDGNVIISMAGPEKEYELVLMDSAGKTILQTSVGLGLTSNKQIASKVMGGQTYYLKVYGYNSAFDVDVPYALSFSLQ